MTISVKAEGRVNLPDSTRDELVKLALEHARENNDDPGPFEDCGIDDVELDVSWGTAQQFYYKLEYLGDADV